MLRRNGYLFLPLYLCEVSTRRCTFTVVPRFTVLGTVKPWVNGENLERGRRFVFALNRQKCQLVEELVNESCEAAAKRLLQDACWELAGCVQLLVSTEIA